MPAESQRAIDAKNWAGLIEAVAKTQDRTAFSTLFEHFAPRVKTFMRRSGASEASADELAQETLLAVWRKAALFDPSSAGASSWIFTIARNLRIDALRHEMRGSALRRPTLTLVSGGRVAPTGFELGIGAIGNTGPGRAG